MKKEISFSNFGGVYYKEGDKILEIYADFRDPLTYITLKDLKSWNYPYEDEEINLEKKNKILKDVEEAFYKSPIYKEGHRIEFDYSMEGNTRYAREVLHNLKMNITLDENLNPKQSIFEGASALFFVFLHDSVKENARFYYELSFDEKMKFKEEIDSDIESILSLFANSKLNKDMDQKNFTYGLYALDMLLKNSNREIIKKTLIAYLEIGKECKLNYNDIMNKSNSYLAELIKEIENTL